MDVMSLPKDMVWEVGRRSDARSLLSLSQTCTYFRKLMTEEFWREVVLKFLWELPIKKIPKRKSPKIFTIDNLKKTCYGCFEYCTSLKEEVLETVDHIVLVCNHCMRNDMRWKSMSRTEAKKTFGLKDEDFEGLGFKEANNQWQSGTKIRLYRLRHIQEIADKKRKLKEEGEEKPKKRKK
eukprot:TRINITY_DN6054_c0_g1_i1.p1 TRINITY_DN6054_c0_g1~~TRINITY_DN6054_c0_g1_i1.p1  ORF type:complete len:180 (-),score=40.00 TRINITY_DN6054_c0_g1_i1:80-619(-)